MKKEVFNDYCQWLFNILSEVENSITIPTDPYQARVFGFLAERLLNIYVRYLQSTNKKLQINDIKSIPEGKF